MAKTPFYKLPIKTQFILSVMIVGLVSGFCFLATEWMGYRIVALILLMTVSIIAMLFDILPVLTAAVLSAITWNFFFIPPVFTFHIENTEDILMFLLYFLIALVNAVLTFKIREAEKKSRDKEEKEKTIRLYNTLLHSLSHELKTPISTILGAVDTLNEDTYKLNKTQQHELLTQIELAGIRLNRQVENLLNMSRLESGMLKARLDWCDLNELVNSVLQKLNQGIKKHFIFQENEKMPLFMTDSGFVEQILFNLVQNAIIYTPENSVISVELQTSDNGFCLIIEDNGQGFPETEFERVFEKFYRLPQTKVGGSGLGLAIVKGFTEALNGSIKLVNNKQGGASFKVYIPARISYINQLKNE